MQEAASRAERRGDGMKYLFQVPVISVHGHQVYEVTADSLEEAKQKISEQDCEYHSEEIEVQELDFSKAHPIRKYTQ